LASSNLSPRLSMKSSSLTPRPSRRCGSGRSSGVSPLPSVRTSGTA
jgi:hypothetical protein